MCLWRRWVMNWCLFKVIFIFSITEINVSNIKGAFCSLVSQSVSSLNVNCTNIIVFQRDVYSIFNSLSAQQNSRLYPSSNLAVLMFMDVFCLCLSVYWLKTISSSSLVVYVVTGAFSFETFENLFFSNQQLGALMKLDLFYRNFQILIWWTH